MTEKTVHIAETDVEGVVTVRAVARAEIERMRRQAEEDQRFAKAFGLPEEQLRAVIRMQSGLCALCSNVLEVGNCWYEQNEGNVVVCPDCSITKMVRDDAERFNGVSPL